MPSRSHLEFLLRDLAGYPNLLMLYSIFPVLQYPVLLEKEQKVSLKSLRTAFYSYSCK